MCSLEVSAAVSEGTIDTVIPCLSVRYSVKYHFHRGDKPQCDLLSYDIVQFGRFAPTCRRNILLQSPGCGIFSNSLKERYHHGDIDIHGRIILKRILENKNGVDWIHLANYMGQKRVVWTEQ
jgi:hypothetical protein